MLRALCASVVLSCSESVLLSCLEPVLLSCTNSPSWPVEMPRLCCNTCARPCRRLRKDTSKPKQHHTSTGKTKWITGNATRDRHTAAVRHKAADDTKHAANAPSGPSRSRCCASAVTQVHKHVANTKPRLGWQTTCTPLRIVFVLTHSCACNPSSQCCCPARTHRAGQAGRDALSLL